MMPTVAAFAPPSIGSGSLSVHPDIRHTRASTKTSPGIGTRGQAKAQNQKVSSARLAYKIMIEISQSTLEAWSEEYNRTLFDGQLVRTRVVWAMKLLSTAGKTKFYRIADRCEIELNPKLLDEASKVRNTLVHELCHAAVFMIDRDASDGHGPKWQRWVDRSMKLDSRLAISVYHHYRSSYRFHYVCSAAHGRCRIAYGSQSPLAPSALGKYRCRQCLASLKYAATVSESLYLAHILKARRMSPSWAPPPSQAQAQEAGGPQLMWGLTSTPGPAVYSYEESSSPSIDMTDACCASPSHEAEDQVTVRSSLDVDELKIALDGVTLTRLSCRRRSGSDNRDQLSEGMKMNACTSLNSTIPAVQKMPNSTCYELSVSHDDDEACIALYKLYLYLHCKAIAGVCELSGGGRAYVVPHSTTATAATTATGDVSATRRPAERVLVFHVSAPDP